MERLGLCRDPGNSISLRKLLWMVSIILYEWTEEDDDDDDHQLPGTRR